MNQFMLDQQSKNLIICLETLCVKTYKGDTKICYEQVRYT